MPSQNQVNRIYQGRVVRVELENNKKWEECKNWESLLLNHHEIFQDAVNYYLLCFVALAGNKKQPSDNKTCPVYRLREQIEKEKWKNFPYKGVQRNGMQESVKKYLFPNNPSSEFKNCLDKVLGGNNVDKESLHKALTALLKHCSGNSSIQQGGREFAPAFFKKNYNGKGAYKEGIEANEKKIKFEEFKRKLWDDNLPPNTLADSIDPKYVLILKNTDSYTGSKLKNKLNEAIEALKEEDVSKQEIKNLENIIDRKIKENLEIPSYGGGGGNIGSRSKAFILFKYVEPNNVTRDFLKKTIRRPKDVNLTETIESQNLPLAVNGKDPIEYCRGDRGYIFPAFTALPRWGGADLGEPQWKEFDIAAFKEALTVIHQIDNKTKEREKEKQKKKEKTDRMEQQSHNDSETEELPFIGHFEWNRDNTVLKMRGNTGDPRVKRLRELLETELAQEYFGEDEGANKIPYGLRRRTLRGFSEIQKKWQNKLKNNQEFSEELKQKLKEELNSYQKKNKSTIGSTPLFNELLEEKNWIIWKKPTEVQQKEYNEKGFSENPLSALCDWYELKEDIKKLDKPIQFTPADPEHSRRLFRFGDVASGFNSMGGQYGHDKDSLSFRVPVIIETNGKLEQQKIKIYYSAPRLFRDSLRKQSGEELEKMPWLQPIMSALSFSKPLEQNFSKCNVQFMPDKTKSGQWRFLLNFPITLKIEKLQCQIAQKSKVDWKKNCKRAGNRYLKWPKNSNWDGDTKMDQVDWFKNTDSFSCLSIDLGQRSAGAFALIKASLEKEQRARFIGSAEDNDWYAVVKAMGLLRLPGEDMKFYQKGVLKAEPYGYKGRKASEEEHKEAKKIIYSLIGKKAIEELLGEQEEQEKLSFPELNDKLLVAIRRSQGKLSQYYRWSWMLGENSKKEKALKEIKEQEDEQEWSELAKEKGKAQKLQTLVKGKIPNFQKKIEKDCLILVNRILPLRSRQWEWIQHPEKSDCRLLTQTDFGTDTTNKKIQGQRGLSMKRIEQIEELRCRFQSLNQSQRKKPGDRPPSWAEMRNNPVPDPCPDLLKKLEELKKQRVNQTAHLILVKALGVKLKAPSKPEKERKQKDIHGEYEKAHDPVNFIVIEDLSRYLTKQDRSPSENSRLMKWSHRAVTNKLKELCEPYGIPVLEVPAAYSSKFCSRTGIPGFRAEEITIRDRNRYPYKQWLEKDEKEDEDEKSRREFLENFFKILKNHKKQSKNGKLKTALVPKPGGPIFVPIKEYTQGTLRSAIIQADINAAINVGLRAIASPLIEGIHHRVRSETKEKQGNKKIVVRKGSIEKRRFRKETEIKLMKEKDMKKIHKKSNFFIDWAKVANFEKAEIESVKYASGKAVWTEVKNKQWNRCKKLNEK